MYARVCAPVSAVAEGEGERGDHGGKVAAADSSKDAPGTYDRPARASCVAMRALCTVQQQRQAKLQRARGREGTKRALDNKLGALSRDTLDRQAIVDQLCLGIRAKSCRPRSSRTG